MRVSIWQETIQVTSMFQLICSTDIYDTNVSRKDRKYLFEIIFRDLRDIRSSVYFVSIAFFLCILYIGLYIWTYIHCDQGRFRHRLRRFVVGLRPRATWTKLRGAFTLLWTLGNMCLFVAHLYSTIYLCL